MVSFFAGLVKQTFGLAGLAQLLFYLVECQAFAIGELSGCHLVRIRLVGNKDIEAVVVRGWIEPAGLDESEALTFGGAACASLSGLLRLIHGVGYSLSA